MVAHSAQLHNMWKVKSKNMLSSYDGCIFCVKLCLVTVHSLPNLLGYVFVVRGSTSKEVVMDLTSRKSLTVELNVLVASRSRLKLIPSIG